MFLSRLWRMQNYCEDKTAIRKVTERELFQSARGTEYTLDDLRVLDLGSLHWSCPESVGKLAPPRVFHRCALTYSSG